MLKLHLSLPVTDLAATEAFYATLFNAPPSKSKGDYLKFEPDETRPQHFFYAGWCRRMPRDRSPSGHSVSFAGGPRPRVRAAVGCKPRARHPGEFDLLLCQSGQVLGE